MAADKAPELPRLFSRLQLAIENEDDEEALNLTKTILDISRDDPDALHCRVVSMIHLSRFDSALQLIRSINKRRKGGDGKLYRLEEAYCLYRQDKYQDTLSILATLPRDDHRLMELEAQVAYRQEEYAKARERYEQLLSLEKDKEERVANYYAAASLSGEVAMGDVPRLSNTMEQCFNLACSRLVSGRGEEAMDLLNKAESLYRQSLEEEGLTDEEMAEEMAVIEVQKGYCYHVSREYAATQNSLLGEHTCGCPDFRGAGVLISGVK
jgi:signal recognition particle subunit SRP72